MASAAPAAPAPCDSRWGPGGLRPPRPPPPLATAGEGDHPAGEPLGERILVVDRLALLRLPPPPAAPRRQKHPPRPLGLGPGGRPRAGRSTSPASWASVTAAAIAW